MSSGARFDFWLSANLPTWQHGGVDPAMTEHFGAEHPLARHLGGFLTDLSDELGLTAVSSRRITQRVGRGRASLLSA
jgi:hypothetical protein